MAKKAAKGLALGLSPTQALREAGYPPATVNRSRAGINKMIRAELGKPRRKHMELGRDLSPEDQEALERGRLMENTIPGNDRGTLSAKVLGSDRRVAMWRGTLAGRAGFRAAPPVPKVDHEVPWLEPEHSYDEEVA